MQHVARLWRPTPGEIERGVLRLANSIPPITYSPLVKLLYQNIQFRDSVEQLGKCVENFEKRPHFQADFKHILDLTNEHVRHIESGLKISGVSHDNFVIGRGLYVPFKPMLVLTLPNREVLPWLLPWKKQALNSEQLSLLSEMIRSRMAQRPDLDSVELEFWDYSVSKSRGRSVRELTVVPAKHIPRLSQIELRNKLEIFAEGFISANSKLAAEKASVPVKENDAATTSSDRQTTLF